MSRLIRRGFSTLPPQLGRSHQRIPPPPSIGSSSSSSSPSSSSSSNTSHPSHISANATLPWEVRIRRNKYPAHPLSSPSPLTDPSFHDQDESTSKRLPMKLQKEFDRQRLNGRFPGPESRARAEFLKACALWRGRVRGRAMRRWQFIASHSEAYERVLVQEGVIDAPPARDQAEEAAGRRSEEEEEQAALVEDTTDQDTPLESIEGRDPLGQLVAQRIYLPNITVRLVRNYTPPGEPYDPYIATFRIPPELTKLDLRSYLKAVYDLDVTFIRTSLYYGKIKRDPQTKRIGRVGGWKHHYKRAVVGLYEPFHYPDDIDELLAQGEKMGLGKQLWEVRNKFLQTSFFVEAMDAYKKAYLNKIYQKTQRWKGKREGTNQGHIMRAIAAKRREREERTKVEAIKKRAAYDSAKSDRPVEVSPASASEV